MTDAVGWSEAAEKPLDERHGSTKPSAMKAIVNRGPLPPHARAEPVMRHGVVDQG